MRRNPPLLTSIRLENGQFDLLEYHTERVNRSRWFLFGEKQPLDLLSALAKQHPPSTGLYKTRILYRKAIERIEFVPYHKKEIQHLQLVDANGLNYRYKFTDRRAIQALYMQRGAADDVLFVIDKQITDTSYTNVAFWDGKAWVTPHRPLLAGTRRQQLLDDRKIYLADIQLSDLTSFSKVRLFNAMIPWEDAHELSTDLIKK